MQRKNVYFMTVQILFWSNVNYSYPNASIDYASSPFDRAFAVSLKSVVQMPSPSV